MDTFKLYAIRCSCLNMPVKYEQAYEKLLADGKLPEQALNELGIMDTCCRNLMLNPQIYEQEEEPDWSMVKGMKNISLMGDSKAIDTSLPIEAEEPFGVTIRSGVLNEYRKKEYISKKQNPFLSVIKPAVTLPGQDIKDVKSDVGQLTATGLIAGIKPIMAPKEEVKANISVPIRVNRAEPLKIDIPRVPRVFYLSTLPKDKSATPGILAS